MAFFRVMGFIRKLFFIFCFTLPSAMVASMPAIEPRMDLMANPPPPDDTCGLHHPKREYWDAGMDEDVKAWTNKVWADLKKSNYSSSAMYLAETYAPDLVASQQFCDTVDACSLSSCQNLNKSLAVDERQAAYYVFESLSNIAHTYASTDKALQESTRYMLENSKFMVEIFSSFARLKKERLEAKKLEEALMAIPAGLLLIAAGLTNGLTLLPSMGLLTTARAVETFLGSTFIGATNLARQISRDHGKDIDLDRLYRESLNEVFHNSTHMITTGLMDLVKGKSLEGSDGLNLPKLITSGDFVERIPDLYVDLKEVTDRYQLASTVSSLWMFDRAYILDTDVSQGSCDQDSRASSEDDFAHDGQALVKAPTGLVNFLPKNNAEFYGITKEDVVRSSLWVHENDLEDQLLGGSVDHIVKMLKNSTVWSEKSRNYPCMCGEFAWDDGTWSMEKDETRKFLERTGFKYSEDWEDYCSNHNDCKKAKHEKWNFVSDTEDDPPIPEQLESPFRKCETEKHKTHGHPEEDFP
ncbi:hypothetical protein BDV95DRAFT_601389 [Massariosphaeria phaeospora]|uniref:Uncharacterized protein n=1 Tax=Massariosphaeria phaeospora TaxID=100035 RepID=A0A7C8MI78_9PLEO|nr:hypothetical protein BDV95DRAFT_601389 [Massariosphaeria phaeospora]